jgi:hypothetical protein
VISSKNGAIRGLEVEYDMCGQSCVSTHGFMFDERVKIGLNYPLEYLQQIEGSYDDVRYGYDGQHGIGITSITFKSNFRAYGPYGKPGKVYPHMVSCLMKGLR